MEVKDLMIDDWVNAGHLPIKVELNDMVSNIDLFEPIPLTKEILELNGFEYDFVEKEYVYKSDSIETVCDLPNVGISECDGNTLYFRVIDIKKVIIDELHIKYVHQLQHALRLCGLTELANNFKVE